MGKWLASIIPWLFDHGIKILIIAAGSWILYKIICRIIIRTVRLAVVRDKQMPAEAEKNAKTRL